MLITSTKKVEILSAKKFTKSSLPVSPVFQIPRKKNIFQAQT